MRIRRTVRATRVDAAGLRPADRRLGGVHGDRSVCRAPAADPAGTPVPAVAGPGGARSSRAGSRCPGRDAEGPHRHDEGWYDRGSHDEGRGDGQPTAPRPDPAGDGPAICLDRVPAFGRDWQFAIVEGTALSQLELGPGHVRGTGLPGQPGNFVVAAHDVTAGNPFLHLRALRYPAKVYVYTHSRVYEYAVRSERITRYTNVGVEYPVPGHPGAAPHRSLITLITCTPVTLAFTPWRIVVSGELISVSARK